MSVPAVRGSRPRVYVPWWLLWALAFAAAAVGVFGIVVAVFDLVATDGAVAPTTQSSVRTTIAQAVLEIALPVVFGSAVLAGLWAKRGRAAAALLRLGRPRPAVRGLVVGAGAYVAAMYCAEQIGSWFLAVFGAAGRSYPWSVAHLPGEGTALMLSAVGAGMTEEIGLLALPAGLMAAAGRPVWQQACVAVVLRVALHLYYGWGAVSVVLWVAAALVIIGVTKSVWPLVVGHAAWDSLVWWEWLSSGSSAGVVRDVVMGFGLMGVAVWVFRRRYRPAVDVVDCP